MFGRKKQEQNNLKEQLVDFAFNKLLKEGEDYTVAARANGMILVKKIARWAYCDVSGQDIQALFSIETDKGLFCFQVKGKEVMRIITEVCTPFYPMLKP